MKRKKLSVGAQRGPISTVGFRLSAFTLIELMVVIGIIGLLITIIVPSFAAVRKRASSTATTATISAISLGLEGYRTDSKLGEQYPPSYGIAANANGVVNPHMAGMLPWVGGANLVAWALAGADLLGTPGFRNLDADSTNDPYGGWISDTGTTNNPGTKVDLHAINADGSTAQTRYGPYVDISKMSFPKPDGTGKFVPEKLDTKPQFNSLCFLDTFHQPILYYKANVGKPFMADDDPNPATNTGVYNLNDNAGITGSAISTTPGLNFGAGQIAANQYHPIYKLDAAGTNPAFPATFLPMPMQVDKGTFGHTIWNPNVTAVPKPQRDDSFILLSAGPDGQFGTGDDIGNFPIND